MSIAGPRHATVRAFNCVLSSGTTYYENWPRAIFIASLPVGVVVVSLALALLTLLSGTTKSVSVCGVNSAAVARPAAGGSRPGVLLYAVGLYAGALALVLVVRAIGLAFVTISGLDGDVRRILAVLVLVSFATIEARRGPVALPHIAWAVPSSWASKLRSEAFLLLFGLIRGIAIFNHSPFASMHAWLLLVILLPREFDSPYIAVAFAAGLGLWSFSYALRSAFRRSRADSYPIAGLQSLRKSNLVARIDAAALGMLGMIILLAQPG